MLLYIVVIYLSLHEQMCFHYTIWWVLHMWENPDNNNSNAENEYLHHTHFFLALMRCVTYCSSLNIYLFFIDFCVSEWIKCRITKNYPEAFHILKIQQQIWKVSNTLLKKKRENLGGLSILNCNNQLTNLNWFDILKINNKTKKCQK